LLARQGANAQVGLGQRARTVAGQDVAEVVGAPRIATCLHHGVKPTDRGRGRLGERLAHERQVWVHPARPAWLWGSHDAGLAEHAAHGP